MNTSITFSSLDDELLNAVIENKADEVERLLNEGANPNCFEDGCQIKPLHFAAAHNAIAVIFPLVKAGAKLNAVNIDGYTPADLAVQLRHTNMANLFISLMRNITDF